MKVNIKKRIKEIRIKNGLSQHEAAKLLQVSKRTFEKWEQGVNNMHPAFFELFQIKTGTTDAES